MALRTTKAHSVLAPTVLDSGVFPLNESENVNTRLAQPILKWVGGKGSVLPELMSRLPKRAHQRRHIEPFIGGGAFFFARCPSDAYIADANQDLVEMYRAVRDDVSGVIDELYKLKGEHSKEGAYYKVRENFNQTQCEFGKKRAAQFIYLNRTGFNGLYRVNRSGQFNVPEGRYTNPKIVDEVVLNAASEALQTADLRHAMFEELIDVAKPGDFIYLDPPYEPVSRTSNFTSYGKDGFSTEDQARLADLCFELDRKGCLFMLSNSTSPVIYDLYSKFNIDVIQVRRAINSNANARGAVGEVVVRNY